MNTTYAIYFSPTGSTESIVKTIANKFGHYEEIDLSQRTMRSYTFTENDLCIIGIPSYGGRVPSIAIERLQHLNGKHAKAILVAVYGNRAYEDTLMELENTLNSKHFKCIAAIAAVAEHSIMHQFATGRPDSEDIAQLEGFAKTILDRINRNSISDMVKVPGNVPYKEYKGVPLKPKVAKTCKACGLCARKCPTGAISISDPRETNLDMCISCMRCIEICPEKSRKLNKLLLAVASKKMKKVCSDRKNNELFL